MAGRLWSGALSCQPVAVGSVALDDARPLLIRGLLPTEADALLPEAALQQDRGEVKLEESPSPWAPVKLPNASLVRPAPRPMAFTDAVNLLAARAHRRPDGVHRYIRHTSLQGLPGLSAALPLQRALDLVGPRLDAVNLWLGDGSLHSATHFDDRDNLILLMGGRKEILLLPPAQLTSLGYASREERQFVRQVAEDGSTSFEGSVPTGRAPVENHSPYDPASGEQIPCYLSNVSAGEALFIPALWSHAVRSSATEAVSASDGTSAGASAVPASRSLHAMVNLWYVRGMHSFDAAVRAAPAFAPAHAVRGSALRSLGRLTEAGGAYRRALQLRAQADEPFFSDATQGLALTLLELERYSEAVPLLRASAMAVPLSTGAQTTHGLALQQLSRDAEAAFAFRAALSSAPSDGRAHLHLGTSLARASRFSEAVRSFTQAAVLLPTDSAAYHQLGLALGDTGQLQRAVRALEKAVDLEPTSGAAGWEGGAGFGGSAPTATLTTAAARDLAAARRRHAIAGAGGWSRTLEARLRSEL